MNAVRTFLEEAAAVDTFTLPPLLVACTTTDSSAVAVPPLRELVSFQRGDDVD
jgi:hypothetical protein